MNTYLPSYLGTNQHRCLHHNQQTTSIFVFRVSFNCSNTTNSPASSQSLWPVDFDVLDLVEVVDHVICSSWALD